LKQLEQAEAQANEIEKLNQEIATIKGRIKVPRLMCFLIFRN
jgi:hypothetical protein